nr:hypothetical protein [Tanacetum cinerariifolium]
KRYAYLMLRDLWIGRGTPSSCFVIFGSKGRVYSLLLTSMCCDDAYHVTPRVFALAGCDRLVSEPLVIEKILFRSTGYSISEYPEKDSIEEDPLEEPKEKV